MKLVEKHVEDIKRYKNIIMKSNNPNVISDYSKAVVRLQRELKTYCKFRGLNYNKILKK